MATAEPSSSPLRSASGLSSDFTVLTPPGMNNCDFDPTTGLAFPLSMASLTSSHLSLEEALRRVMDLMKENQELKDTLLNSNSSMKQACETLTQWKEAHEAEKVEMDKERKEMVERKEQAKAVIIDLQKAIQERDEYIRSMKEQNAKFGGGDRCTESVREELIQMQSDIKRRTSEVEEANRKTQEMQSKLDEMKAKNEELCQEQVMLRDSENDLKLVMQALKDEKQMLEDKFANMNESLHKMRETVDNIQMEKRDLVALNNDLTAQIHQLKAQPIELESTVAEESEMVIVEKPKDRTIQELIDQAAANDPSLRASHFDMGEQSSDSQDVGVRRRGQGQNSMSGLLIQMQDERSKVSELMIKLAESDSKVEMLEKEIRDKDQQMNEITAKLDTTVEQGQNDKTEVQRLNSQVHQMQVELQKQQDQRQMNPGEDIQNYRAQVYSLCEELKACQQNMDAMANNKRIVEERCQQLESKCLLYQEEIESQRAKDDQLIEALRVTITSLETALHSEQAKYAQKSAASEELQKKFDSLVRDYHELLQCNEELQANRGTAGGMSTQDKRRYDERIDHLTAQIVCSEEALKKRDNKIRELFRDRDELTEQVHVLNAQADVFRDDFEAERSAREAGVTDKEKLKEEIHQLQLRNQQLQDEVQNMSSYQWGAMRTQQGTAEHRYNFQPGPVYPAAYPHPGPAYPEARPPGLNPGYNYGNLDQCDDDRPGATGETARPRTPVQRPPSAASQGENAAEYICPKCMAHFESMDVLQLHVMDCIQ